MSQPRDNPDRGTERFDPRELLRIASLHRWLIVAVTAVVVGTAGLLTFTATPYYRAKARVLIERSGSTVALQEIYQLSTGTDDYYLTQHKIIESRAVAAAALALLPEADQSWFRQKRAGDPVAAFQRLCEVMPVLKSRLVDVVADHPDPQAAARMAEAVVTAYVQNGLERQSDASSLALERLKKDALELQAKLIAAEHAVQEFKGQNEIVAMNDRQSLTSARLEKLNEELAEIERVRNEAGSRLQTAEHATVDAALDNDLPEVLGSPVVADCKRALLSTRAELSQLAQVYKPRHPHILALASKAEAIEEQLGQEIAAVQKGLQRQYERATLRETDVRRRLEEQTRALLELEGKVIQYDILRNEAEATRKLHDTVLNRLKEVQLIHGAETTNVHRIGPAEVSPRPVRPNKTLHLLLALLGGLLLGSASAWAIDLCDRTMKGADDVGACLGVPVLGQVPRFLDRAADGTGLDPATEDERSAVSEAFRTIRTALSFTDAGRDMRSLLVTSTSPEEGKSTVSINLAVAFARAGRRVLLVDADLRRPRLHRVFGVAGEQGFSSLLIGSQTFAALVRSTGVENLWLLPCGVIPPNPVELLGSPGMRAAYLEMTASFDLVVFDSPPAGVVSDANVLATFADRAAFVVRSLHTNRTQAQRVVAQLQSVGSRIAGAIVNHSDVRAACYGGYELDYSYRPHAEPVEAEA